MKAFFNILFLFNFVCVFSQSILSPVLRLTDFDTTLIPDGAQQLRSSFYNNFFNANDTISAGTQIQSLSIDMFHSYSSDLVINLICPNGKSATIFNGGTGGTTFGKPPVPSVSGSSTPCYGQMGDSYSYFWNNLLTNSTMQSITSNPIHTYSNICGQTIANRYYPAGDYKAEQSFNTFVGCPLNGLWSLEITDRFHLDEGYITAWSLNFDYESPNCASVNDLTVSIVADTSVRLTWNHTAPMFEIEYSEDNVIPGGGRKFYTSENEFVIDSLNGSTMYSVIIRPICTPSDSGRWSNRVYFSTQCYNSVSLPFFESFESYPPLNCFQVYSAIISTDTLAQTGSKSISIRSNDYSPAIFQSPFFTLPESSELQFYYKYIDSCVSKNTDPNFAYFDVTTNGGLNWICLDTLSNFSEQDQFALVSHSFDTLYTNFSFRFRMMTNIEDQMLNKILIDDIKINSELFGNEAEILAFTINDQLHSDVLSSEGEVNVYMPQGTDLTSLTPVISISEGASIAPGSGIAHDFTMPVIYSVTAVNGLTVKNWTVNVVAENSINEKETSIMIYPNPTSDLLNIDLKSWKNDLFKISIISVDGQIVFLKDVAFNGAIVELNIKDLSSGIYLLKMSSNNVNYQFKIQKK